MKVIPTLEAESEKELLTKNFENLVSETKRILQSSNVFEAFQLAALENDTLFSLYDDFEKVLNLTAEIAPEDKRDILQILKDGQEVSEEVYRLFASAWMTTASGSVVRETVKTEGVVEIRNRAYEKAISWVKEGVVEIPSAELEAVRRDMLQVKELNKDIFNQLQEQIGSVILFRAEGKSQLDVARALRLAEILFGQKQSNLARNTYLAYKILFEQTGFELKFREGDMPAFNTGTINLIRNKLDAWFQQHDRSQKESNEAEALLFSIDSFLIGISRRNNPARADDLIYQRKMRAGIRQVRGIDGFVYENLMPKDIVDLFNFIEKEMSEVNCRLTQELAKAGTIDFSESKAYLQDLQFLIHRLVALHQEVARLINLEEEALAKELMPSTTNNDRLIKYLELEIKQMRAEDDGLMERLDCSNLNQKEANKIKTAAGKVAWAMAVITKLRDIRDNRSPASPLTTAKADRKEAVYELR